jgi:acyl-coenzyme A synthetase/AMP-(fatty) acid ligase
MTSMALPLLAGYRPDAVFAYHRGGLVHAAAFESAAAGLAARLPPRQYVANLCEDRYAFMLGFAASLLAGQTTLLPPSRAPQAVRDSCEGHDAYVLTEEQVFAAQSAPPRALIVEPDHVAAIVFTSGSTGRPVGHAKSWASLVAGARALGVRLAIRPGTTVLGTVPPQHMFGLESTVMLPWQNGLAVHSSRPLLPADLGETAGAVAAPCWLMTSPLHLRACVAARR